MVMRRNLPRVTFSSAFPKRPHVFGPAPRPLWESHNGSAAAPRASWNGWRGARGGTESELGVPALPRAAFGSRPGESPAAWSSPGGALEARARPWSDRENLLGGARWRCKSSDRVLAAASPTRLSGQSLSSPADSFALPALTIPAALRSHTERRMPTSGYPEPSRQNETRSIQLEGSYGCPSDVRRPVDSSCALGPCEVLLPWLLPWIEDSHPDPGLRIDNEEAVALVFVTRRTGQPEVVLRRRPAEGSRKQMIELHRSADDNFLGQAVTATISRLACDSASQRDRDVDGAHCSARSPETSCPRSLSSLAACARINIVRSYSCMSFARAASSLGLSPSSRCLK